MRTIDLSTWPRRKHFEMFRSVDYPHFNLCANVDISRFYPAVKAAGDISFTLATVYVLARVANSLPEFRWRIRGEEVVEHEVVHPSFTVLAEDDLFSFCTTPYHPDFRTFLAQAAAIMEQVKKNPTLEDEPGADNLLFMTGIPWVSFTGLMHPIHMHPVDSVPRIAWGKFAKQGEALVMPLSVQGHHGLLDGLHAGRFFGQVQELLDRPESLLGGQTLAA